MQKHKRPFIAQESRVERAATEAPPHQVSQLHPEVDNKTKGYILTRQRPDQRYGKGDSAINQTINSHLILNKYAKIQVEQKMASLQTPLETGRRLNLNPMKKELENVLLYYN